MINLLFLLLLSKGVTLWILVVVTFLIVVPGGVLFLLHVLKKGKKDKLW